MSSDDWSGPLQPPPFWLDPSREVTVPWRPTKLDFIRTCRKALLDLGLSPQAVLEVSANSMIECGWAKKGVLGFNLGGVKIRKDTSRDASGIPRLWWRALGHKGSGDPHTCFYRAWPSVEDFFKTWLPTYLPHPPSTGRYAKTGEAFHAGRPWFPELIKAGYKGAVTQRNPEGSIKAFGEVVSRLRSYWAQELLGKLVIDGVWGAKSAKALNDWLGEEGTLNQETFERLLSQKKAGG